MPTVPPPPACQRSDMRLATIASAFAIMICAAVFGAILLQKISVSVHASLPAQGTSANRQAPTPMSADALTTNASGAGATALMVTSPPPAYPSVATVSSCEGNPNALDYRFRESCHKRGIHL